MQATGGKMAHIARRLFHVISISFIPFVYYRWFEPVFSEPMFPVYIVIAACFFAMLFELARIHYGWMIFGQRTYEKGRFSAFAWSVVALSLLLIASPSEYLTMPIALSCALADPLAGELRLRHAHPKVIFALPAALIFLIWFYYGYTWWVSAMMAVLTVVVERPVIEWVDDNALMLLAPFLFYWVLHFFCLV